MEAHHWFLFGMMVAWTPSVVVMAVSMHRAVSDEKSASRQS